MHLVSSMRSLLLRVFSTISLLHNYIIYTYSIYGEMGFSFPHLGILCHRRSCLSPAPALSFYLSFVRSLASLYSFALGFSSSPSHSPMNARLSVASSLRRLTTPHSFPFLATDAPSFYIASQRFFTSLSLLPSTLV